MSSSDVFLVSLFSIAAIAVLWIFRKSGHFFKSLFLSAVSGIGGLCFVNIIAPLTGVSLGANPFTLTFSALSGLSGVIAMLFARLI